MGDWEDMHDWSLLKVEMDWLKSSMIITVEGWKTGLLEIKAEGLLGLILPHRCDWSYSESILEVKGPFASENGSTKMIIQMQSGDEIEFEAQTIKRPSKKEK